MKIAIIHDFLTNWGGAEQVLLSFHRLWPEAPIYTLLYDEKLAKEYFPKAEIIPSFLQKFPAYLKKRKKYLLPFMATAPETFDLREFDLVVSSSNSFAKGVITRPQTKHICYCHSPARFIWDWHRNYLKEQKIGLLKKLFVWPMLHYIRLWDSQNSSRVDYFIANSKTTAARINKFYRREAKVIYPPVDINKSKSNPPAGGQKPKIPDKNYYLIVSRLSPYKRVDLAVEAFNKLELPLIVIGEGEQRKKLEKIAKPNIKFLGFVPEKDLSVYYQNAKAFIFPGEDDFGIAPIEAMSMGAPVLSYRKGGLTETNVEGVTGEFFDDPLPEILAEGVRRMEADEKKYQREKISEYARRFSRERFENEIENFIREKIKY